MSGRSRVRPLYRGSEWQPSPGMDRIGRYIVNKILTSLVLMVLALGGSLASADEYSDTINVFKVAGESASFFNNCYGYAVFPSIGKGGPVVGAAHGNGRVYERVSTLAIP